MFERRQRSSHSRSWGQRSSADNVFIQLATTVFSGSTNTCTWNHFVPLLAVLLLTDLFVCYLEDHAVTEAHLDLLRSNIGSKWKLIARQLSLTSVDIETIEHDYYRDGLPEIVHQMLERWRNTEGSPGCTFGKLCQALSGNITLDVMQKMLDICGSSYSNS